MKHTKCLSYGPHKGLGRGQRFSWTCQSKPGGIGVVIVVEIHEFVIDIIVALGAGGVRAKGDGGRH